MRSLFTRLLGVGLAAGLSSLTILLWWQGKLGLYVNPDAAWYIVGGSVLLLVAAVASAALPLGQEADHGHDHGDGHDHGESQGDARGHGHETDARSPRVLATGIAVVGGVMATGFVCTALLMPPAALSAQIAQARSLGSAPLFAGSDVVSLASTGDTASFGVGDWASVFATATDTEPFEGKKVTLVGFVTPGSADGFSLTRLVITHCVIDAQTATIPVRETDVPATGQWVRVEGTIQAASNGRLAVVADEVTRVSQPADPYEY